MEGGGGSDGDMGGGDGGDGGSVSGCDGCGGAWWWRWPRSRRCFQELYMYCSPSPTAQSSRKQREDR